MNKKILGLDLGTNSIGWALILQDFENKQGEILGIGSRIIPMDQGTLGKFAEGSSISQTAERTSFRNARRLRERYLLRRERLHRVLNILNFLPEHYVSQIDFEKHLGKFKEETELKLTYKNKEFIFKTSFDEMLADFRQHQPHVLVNEKGKPKLVPYDWAIYYLRKKALSKKIEKEELAWILLNFNQKRGYYQLRGEEEGDNPNKKIEFHSLKIIDVIADEIQKDKTDIWYSLILEHGWIYRRQSKTPLFDWKDKIRDFIVTTDLNNDGSIKTDKEGKEKRSFRAPGEDDWTLLKKKTEQEIDQSGKTVGAFIYDTLLQNPNQKIKGKLVRTIERKFYKEELRRILEKQIELQPELFTSDLYSDCIRELYRNNESQQSSLSKRDFVHLFINDIIFYQRPLRSQKSSISNCSLEFRNFKDENGNKQKQYLKAIPKSNPYYQEFRIWQWMYNLSVYKKDDDTNVSKEFLSSIGDMENLFDFLNNRKEIEQKPLIKYLLEQKGLKGKLLNAEVEKFRWNYVEDKQYPCNETATLIREKLTKIKGISENFLTRGIEQSFWHLVYSVTDKHDYEKALKSFAAKHSLDEDSFVDIFRKFPPFKSEYGSFSEKAIKKLLPLLRVGKYWNWDTIDKEVQIRIDHIIDAEANDEIRQIVKEKADKHQLRARSDFQGLPLWLAQYIVYNRHSEADISEKWNSAKDLEDYLKSFRQHSLRNPIVEQVITETLRVVKDIWVKYGNGTKDFFNEIHIELGREMKNTAADRKGITNQITENENTNLRIKSLLAELKNDPQVENVRPYSPMQQEILKIFEEGVLNADIEIEEDILKISKTAQPSSSDLKRYKLWLEQKYRSPYTGEMIPLNKLFTPEYEIEHIIPQSRYFDDSFSNKVICEAAVNKLKDNQIGLEFIKNHHGEKVLIGMDKVVQVLEVEDYEDFVKQHYAKNRSKRNKLLMEDIPEKMIERQMNDTRYISKFISNLLSNIVRSESNDDGVNSKNIIPGNGKITTELKQDWGLNDVWNELILPRFERMNQLMNTTHFTTWNENHQKLLPAVPLDLSKGFSKKRIDHRHHAMDALVIACATREHVNYMNNEHALRKGKTKEEKQTIRYDLRTKLCDKKHNKDSDQNYEWIFKKPWASFTADAKSALEHIVVSFKQNLRVINKATNYYEKWVDKNGIKVKELQEQKGTNWAIRKSMHKDTISGLVKLKKKKTVSLNVSLDAIADIVDEGLKKEIQKLQKVGWDKKKLSKHFKDLNYKWNEKDISKVEIYYWEKDNVASRVPLNDTFDEDRIKDTITDTGIQKILLNHLKNYKGQSDKKGKEIPAQLLAFSPEGIEEMNKNIMMLNGGKFHQPILKVRTYEPKGNKFNVGQTGNKKVKFVEAAKGTNLFFAIYTDENGNRTYETIPLNIIIERQKQGLSSVPLQNETGEKLLFQFSPNDLVYVSSENDKQSNIQPTFDSRCIYKVVSFTNNRLYAIPHIVAKSIVDKNEFTQLNKLETSLDGLSIKEHCYKLKTDRLGNISKL
ncbi:type II CRISPR RNA-guided endonuclease Cas9 [Asinibacterium sp. OR53]|uniref:type II CRISPR RNA-guided endonuclease Cas9 n=1 Tax=Asinibacterium sp. OR53 TaxID=925409 RepID=UPI00047E9E34|nr:type II CRISPR RNA-guided endonuclease Cas9 [Asinibacterium sp. OR53]